MQESDNVENKALKTLCPYMVMFASYSPIGWFAGNDARTFSNRPISVQLFTLTPILTLSV